MSLKAGLLIFWAAVPLGAACADGFSTVQTHRVHRKHVHQRVISRYESTYAVPGRAMIVPACREVNDRLLRCRPVVRLPHDAPGMLQAQDGPPRVPLRPYPEMFSWPTTTR